MQRVFPDDKSHCGLLDADNGPHAAYYVSFGPHGARIPVTPAGETNKVVLGLVGLLAATGVVWAIARANGT